MNQCGDYWNMTMCVGASSTGVRDCPGNTTDIVDKHYDDQLSSPAPSTVSWERIVGLALRLSESRLYSLNK